MLSYGIGAFGAMAVYGLVLVTTVAASLINLWLMWRIANAVDRMAASLDGAVMAGFATAIRSDRK